MNKSKHFLISALSFFILFAIFGCSASFPSDVDKSTLEVSSPTEVPLEPPSKHMEENTEDVPVDEVEKEIPLDDEAYFLEVGFELMQKESIATLQYGIASAEVFIAMGEPDQKSENVYWGADGLEHQEWFYEKESLRIDMVTDEHDQIVNSLQIQSPSQMQTSRGIGIGTPYEEVLEAYGKEINAIQSDHSAMIVAGTVYGGVVFMISDGLVVEIFIGALSE